MMFYSLLLKFPWIAKWLTHWPLLRKLLSYCLGIDSRLHLAIVESVLKAVDQVKDQKNPRFVINSKYSTIASALNAHPDYTNRFNFQQIKVRVVQEGNYRLNLVSPTKKA